MIPPRLYSKNYSLTILNGYPALFYTFQTGYDTGNAGIALASTQTGYEWADYRVVGSEISNQTSFAAMLIFDAMPNLPAIIFSAYIDGQTKRYISRAEDGAGINWGPSEEIKELAGDAYGNPYQDLQAMVIGGIPVIAYTKRISPDKFLFVRVASDAYASAWSEQITIDLVKQSNEYPFFQLIYAGGRPGVFYSGVDSTWDEPEIRYAYLALPE